MKLKGTAKGRNGNSPTIAVLTTTQWQAKRITALSGTLFSSFLDIVMALSPGGQVKQHGLATTFNQCRQQPFVASHRWETTFTFARLIHFYRIFVV